MNLVLIGLRGSGKSTVGAILAQRLKWAFFDTDSIVQERSGQSIRTLFEQKGEAEFRRLETVAVLECATLDCSVIATGGGAVLDPKNVAALKQNSFVVHLSADPAELWRRILQDKASHDTRPKLDTGADQSSDTGADSGIDELKKLMRTRAAAYAHARNAEVDVEERSPDEVADAVLLLAHAHGVVNFPKNATSISPQI